MTDLKTLKKRERLPVVTDEQLIDKCILSFLEMDMGGLYNKALVVKDQKTPYSIFCTEKLRDYLQFREGEPVSVGRMIEELCEKTVYAINCSGKNFDEKFMNKYLGMLTVLSRIYLRFMIKRPNDDEGGISV